MSRSLVALGDLAGGALNAGVDLSGVSVLMGHSNTSVTETVYGHWQTGALAPTCQEAFARMQAPHLLQSDRGALFMRPDHHQTTPATAAGASMCGET